MNIAIIIVGIFCIVLNLYLGKLHLSLYENGLLHTWKRISFKTLNDSLRSNVNNKGIEKLLKCKKIYITFLTLFYIEILLLVIQIIPFFRFR
jgi:hypothetical protein